MTMQRWDPWADMLSLREAMGRLLEDSYVRPGVGGGTMAGSMALDVYEDADNIEVDASLPGMRPEDVDITVQGDTLVIKGQRKGSAERKQGNYLMREHRSGQFYRAIQLPVQVDADQARANFENGILHLTLPKAASTRPRTIPVTGSQSVQAPQVKSGEANDGQANGG
jgi:HSP20 family protein